jgi:hypothetical protein
MGVASGAGTDYHSGAPEVTLSCKCGSCSSILLFFLCSVLQIVVCLFFLLAIVLPVLRFADSDYPFGVFKLFLSNNL